MSQPQELPGHIPSHELPAAHGAPPTGQYQAPAGAQYPEQQYYAPPPNPPISEYVPTPTQTPAPPMSTAQDSYAPPLPQQPAPAHQYDSYPPQQPQEYYQQPPVQGQYDAEKAGGVPQYAPPAGNGMTEPQYIPPAGGAATGMGAGAGTIAIFGKHYKKKTVIIAGAVALVVLIFIIGLGAGLGSKNKKKKSTSSGFTTGGSSGGDDSSCYTCACFTDPDAAAACYALAEQGQDNASDLIKRMLKGRNGGLELKF